VNKNQDIRQDQGQDRLPWQAMQITPVGRISEIVQIGGGKLSLPFEDSGDDPRKPKGQEM
jgi:hypothetical protein